MKSLLCNFEHPPGPEWQPEPPVERLSTLDHPTQTHKQCLAKELPSGNATASAVAKEKARNVTGERDGART